MSDRNEITEHWRSECKRLTLKVEAYKRYRAENRKLQARIEALERLLSEALEWTEGLEGVRDAARPIAKRFATVQDLPFKRLVDAIAATEPEGET